MRRRPWYRLAVLFGAAALVLGACSGSDGDSEGASASGGTTEEAGGGETAGTDGDTVVLTEDGESVLAAVQAAGTVKCGTRDALPGFAVLDASGDHVGFDSDFCRVIAAAVLGDAEKVDHVDLETADRFTALQSGEVDVLVRNTTWTATRDGKEGATFLQPNFYDGQGMMVKADSGFTKLADMSSAVVCVAKGTTTEGNAASEATRLGLSWQVQSFDSPELIQEAFQAERCDGWSSDRSQLTGLRSSYPDGAASLVILPEVFSKEPLAPAVRDGDSQWAQAVNWAVLATIQAEELGITQANVDQMKSSSDPNVQRFLGVAVGSDPVLDPGLGLPTDFGYQVVKQVGNYGEIFDRHLTPLGLERGVNALWTDGGLLYAPPYR
ncbi:MAG: amino acid ABC transporter substrate-binding protein [Acidimicrobiia bacterium]|nr:amino acid ABC transporter substrate-binding protein [Acidimicrobiia bacterium]